MNSNMLKTIGITSIIIVLLMFILKLFIKALPYVIIAGVVLWVILNIIGFINNRKAKKYKNSSDFENVNNRDNSYSDEAPKVIDVDYKDVD